jgi:hypothetical protein
MTVWRRARVVGDSPSRGGSFARALPGGSPTGAAAAAHGCPATGRSRSRPQRPPMPRDASWSRPSASRQCANRRAKITGPGTERRALSGSAPPASRAPEERF